jgi:hypothetical protein
MAIRRTHQQSLTKLERRVVPTEIEKLNAGPVMELTVDKNGNAIIPLADGKLGR